MGLRAFRPASSIVSWDTDAYLQYAACHTRGRYQKLIISC